MLTRAKQQLGHNFKTWWVYLWLVCSVSLLSILWFLPFYWWAAAAFICFGTMEGYGVANGPDSSYPPLTDVVRCYAPIWATVPAMWGLAVGAGASWLHWPHPLSVSLLAVLIGWLTVHFTDAYYRVHKL